MSVTVCVCVCACVCVCVCVYVRHKQLGKARVGRWQQLIGQCRCQCVAEMLLALVRTVAVVVAAAAALGGAERHAWCVDVASCAYSGDADDRRQSPPSMLGVAQHGAGAQALV